MKPIILSLDPGKTNMAISVVTVERNRPICLANSILQSPLQNLNQGYKESLAEFMQEIEGWMKEFQPQAMIMERFQSRGNKGTTIECISIMIGALTIRYNRLPTKLVIASTWKNAFNRRHDVNLNDIYKICRTTPHQLDATLIGVYGLEVGRNIDTVYTIDSLLDNVEDVSRTPLHKRRLLNAT